MRFGRLLATTILTAFTASGAQAAPFKPNPCLDVVQAENLLCPDLTISPPFSMYLDRKSHKHHKLLRAANSINSVGEGPAELRGFRSGAKRMNALQRIHRLDGNLREVETGATLGFKYVPGFGGNFWKFNHAAQFELWRLDGNGIPIELTKAGEKTVYCLRDLAHTRPWLVSSPANRVYPACNKDRRKQEVTLGTSVGWSDIYPSNYYEQWIDVTGLRGCFAYRQVVDPDNRIYESNEQNNVGQVAVRLPYRRGTGGCFIAPPPTPVGAPTT